MSEKDILQKAKDLIESSKNHQTQEKTIEDNEQKKDSKKESLMNKEESSSTEEDLHPRKLGYKRKIHYKNPKWWHFLGMGLIIVILLWIIILLFPYVPLIL